MKWKTTLRIFSKKKVTTRSTECYENIVTDEENIRKQIKKMSLDTSPGSEVLLKTLRQLNIAKSISSIGNIMRSHSFVPSGFKNGKLILIDEGGDENSPRWRPIMIYSVIRRIIEKALDCFLRDQAPINCNQRGFITGIPGCYIESMLDWSMLV